MGISLSVVFDLDGVLVDSATEWKCIDSQFLRTLIPSWDDERQREIWGMSIFAIYDLLCREHGLKMSRVEFLGEYERVADDIYRSRVRLISGAAECVARLAAAKIPLAVASSSASTWIAIVLERFGFSAAFSAFVGADDVDGEGKPSPRVYEQAVLRLGARPSRCIAIEDSRIGVRSAKAAGLYCVGLRNGRNESEDLSEADREVTTLNEVDPERLYDWLGPV